MSTSYSMNTELLIVILLFNWLFCVYVATIGVSQEVMVGRQLYVYSAYKNMQIFHFNVPPLTSSVDFNFNASDTHPCDPRNVSM